MINPHDRIRGHADVPLTPEGRAQVSDLGKNFMKNGPLHLVATPDLSRTLDTAHAVANDAPVLITPHLRDMDYGRFTGQATRDVIHHINKTILTRPSQPVDGLNGESFDHYADRLTNVAKLAIQASQQYPDAHIGLVVNRRSIKTIQGWLDNQKTDSVINRQTVTSEDPGLKPAAVYKITGSQEGEYGVKPIDPKQPMDEPGVYLVRHGMTAWNGESHKAGSGGIRGVNDMVKNASGPLG